MNLPKVLGHDGLTPLLGKTEEIIRLTNLSAQVVHGRKTYTIQINTVHCQCQPKVYHKTDTMLALSGKLFLSQSLW